MTEGTWTDTGYTVARSYIAPAVWYPSGPLDELDADSRSYVGGLAQVETYVQDFVENTADKFTGDKRWVKIGDDEYSLQWYAPVPTRAAILEGLSDAVSADTTKLVVFATDAQIEEMTKMGVIYYEAGTTPDVVGAVAVTNRQSDHDVNKAEAWVPKVDNTVQVNNNVVSAKKPWWRKG